MINLTKSMNWIDLDKAIIEAMSTMNRNEIETELKAAFGWTDRQVYSATDIFYNEKRYTETENKMRRK